MRAPCKAPFAGARPGEGWAAAAGSPRGPGPQGDVPAGPAPPTRQGHQLWAWGGHLRRGQGVLSAGGWQPQGSGRVVPSCWVVPGKGMDSRLSPSGSQVSVSV